MSYERKEGGSTSANNNGYPATSYNGSTVEEIGSKGLIMGASSNKGEFDAEYLVDFSDAGSIPTASNSDRQVLTLPSYAVIKSVDITVLELVAGGTNYNVGLSQPDGTVIDADGLAAAVTATAVGAYTEGAGALVGASIGANSGQVTVTGTRTSGKVRIKIKYIRHND